MADLEGIARHLGVRIEHHQKLHRSRWGEYSEHHRAIRLLDHLGPVQYRSVLAHELGHAHYRHRWCWGRYELHADAWAARTLIRPDCWRDATAAYDDVLTVAAELQVLPRLVEAYALHLTRHPALRLT